MNPKVDNLLKSRTVFLYVETPDVTAIRDVLLQLGFHGKENSYTRMKPHGEFASWGNKLEKMPPIYDGNMDQIQFSDISTIMKTCHERNPDCPTGKELADMLTEKGLRVAVNDYNYAYLGGRALLYEQH